jgi:hypothetical protein
LLWSFQAKAASYGQTIIQQFFRNPNIPSRFYFPVVRGIILEELNQNSVRHLINHQLDYLIVAIDFTGTFSGRDEVVPPDSLANGFL